MRSTEGRGVGVHWSVRVKGLALSGALCALPLISATAPALAGKADVVGVKLIRDAGGTWRAEVTIRSDDRGWQKYADKWEVTLPDGRVLGTRVLLHPHEDEQPFTRELGGLAIPPGVTEVRVRAHDKVEGWGGAEMMVKVPR
ncbi:MAG: hypothetical protein R3D44_00665 [Hyphomicrobiaceae bacterium]